MNYRPNNYPSYYENNPKLGYSNVSKGFGQSYRSNSGFIQIKMMIITSQKLSSCLKTNARNSKKQRINSSMTLTTSVSYVLSFKTN